MALGLVRVVWRVGDPAAVGAVPSAGERRLECGAGEGLLTLLFGRAGAGLLLIARRQRLAPSAHRCATRAAGDDRGARRAGGEPHGGQARRPAMADDLRSADGENGPGVGNAFQLMGSFTVKRCI